jgi:hypothetical protein
MTNHTDDIDQLRSDLFARIDEYLACSEPQEAWWEAVYVLAHMVQCALTTAAKDCASDRARGVALLDHLRQQLDGVSIH